MNNEAVGQHVILQEQDQTWTVCGPANRYGRRVAATTLIATREEAYSLARHLDVRRVAAVPELLREVHELNERATVIARNVRDTWHPLAADHIFDALHAISLAIQELNKAPK